jgi:Tol biopolymer transport system component
MRSTFLAAILFFCLASVSQAAKHDTSFKFSTIETPNFSIHFHQGLEPVAQKAAAMAEEVHGKVVKEFLWQPGEKTQVVLIDDSDFTNGLAVTVPYNTIYLHVVPPNLASTLGEYDDWLKVLFTHEYTHIVTSDPSRGYSKVTRAIFGKPYPALDPLSVIFFIATAPPNTFMPRWWHEGMATWSETEFTGQGRGKGSYFDMVFRAAVAEGNVPRVDEINGDIADWPNGNLPYMYGYRLQRYISDTYGKDALGKLPLTQSGRFPYFIDGAPKQLFGGKSYSDLYTDMVAAVKAEQSQRIAILSKAPFTPVRTVSAQGENLSHPRFSRDGSRIAFTRLDPHDHTVTVITDSTGGRKIGEFRRYFSDESISWSPDGARIYFTQGQVKKGFNVFQDIYAYELSRDKISRLTHGKRVSEAEISPDGKLFAAIVSARGSQNLALIQTAAPDKKESTRPITDYAQQRVSSPHWSPDGKTLCYALTDNAGNTSIRLYDVAGGGDQPLFTVGHTAAYPVWARDGSAIFYTSDETGVFNLFAFDLKERRSYQVTHLLGGALQPDTSPDGRSIIFSSYGSRGFSIAELTLDRSKWSLSRGPALPLTRMPALPPTAEKPAATDKVATDKTVAGQTAADRPAKENSSADVKAVEGADAPAAAAKYNALKTLYPRFWLPRIYGDGSDTPVVGAYTAGADVIGYHSYTLAADYGAGRKRGYFDLLYQNDYFYPTLSLKAHSQPFLYANLVQTGRDYYELNQGFTVDASVPVNFLESRYQIKGGYQLVDQKALSPLDNNGGFNNIRVFQGRRDNLFAGLTFDNVLKYPYSISSEEGRNVSLLYRRSMKEIGSDLNISEYSADYREYLEMPTAALKHHVLYLRLAGALADGDNNFGQNVFQLGGTPSDLNTFPLRGYPERSMTGKYLATGTLEYRAPLFYPMRGYKTLPAFLEKLHGALFVDAGEIWDDHNTFHDNRIKVGAGFEARADVKIAYWVTITPAVGFAHGFNTGGENQVYLALYLNL